MNFLNFVKIEFVNNYSEETSQGSLDFKAFSLNKHKLFYEKLKKFNEELSSGSGSCIENNNNNKNSFEKQMQEDLIFNKYILTNKLLNFHPSKNLIKQKFKEISSNHLKIKMRDNTHFRLNRSNAAINTQAFINQINRHSGTVITTLNELLNSLRNTNNSFQNNNGNNANDIDIDNMDVDAEDLIEDEFFENENGDEFEPDEEMEDEYETIEENSEEEGENHSEENLH